MIMKRPKAAKQWKKGRRVKVAPYRNPSMYRVPQPRKWHSTFFEVGNDYDEKTGSFTPYVDFVSGNIDLVDHVSFVVDKNAHIVRARSPLTLSDNTAAHRFTIGKCFPGSRRIKVVIVGRGFSRKATTFRVKQENYRHRPLLFLEWRRLRPFYFPAPNRDFGIELEMSCRQGTPAQDVVDHIYLHTGVKTKVEMSSYSNAKEPFDGWKLVRDSSIACSRTSPDCSQFELVSPILNGDVGFGECQLVLNELKKGSSISLNKSMGFHVHVSVDSLPLNHIKNICLNFVKYEHVMDSFMPPSRRGDSNNANDFAKSNRASILPNSGSGLKHNAIASCKSLVELCRLMNPGDNRYFKLNLQNIRTGRQPTVEFRQHSCTCNYEKVQAWVRFCMMLVQNSTMRPHSLKPNEDAFELLFDTVIQDLKLKDFYRQRRLEMEEEEEEQAILDLRGSKKCCDACAHGQFCAAATV